MASSKISRRTFVTGAAGAVGATVSCSADASDISAQSAAGFPAQITAIPFGGVSHWLQPWRPRCRTISIAQIETGIGVVQNGFSSQQSALDMLHGHGFRHLRVEIPWAFVDAKTEAKLEIQEAIMAYLARLGSAGLRPLILLNSNHGYPCPAVIFNLTVTSATPQGATSMLVASTAGLVPGRSGFRSLAKLPMCSVLVTGIDGSQVALSKPLPVAIAAGTEFQFATLNYEPFSAPGTPSYERTMQGWLRYADLVCAVATTALGTANSDDRGFDLEIWNELTFGSNFLAINNYYEPPLLKYNARAVWTDLVSRTAAQAAAEPLKYRGVRITDGFANTIPWPAASQEPPRVSAISKHPYPPLHSYPKDQQPNATSLDALGKKTLFIPSYQEYFPEHYANVIQTESLCRDLNDQTNLINGGKHGQLARTVNGEVSPVRVWITEIGCTPHFLGVTDPQKIAALMTLYTLRSLLFHLGIGVERVYIYNAFGAVGDFGLVNSATPDTPSLPLLSLRRMLSAIKGDSEITTPGPLSPIICKPIRSANDMVLFEGDHTPNLPAMTIADSLVLLPVQVSPARIAIIYYVMTRDIRVPLEEQSLAISINAPSLRNFEVSCYDPVADRSVSIDDAQHAADVMTLTLLATDTPRVLIFKA